MHPARCVLLGVLALGACTPTSLPGTQLGTYKVTAQSKSNTCGLAAPDPWVFDVQVSRDGSTLYWSWMDGSPLVSGAIAAGSQATLTDTTTGNVDGSEAGLGPCTMERQDQIQVDVPASAGGALSGTISYSFTAASGADCSDQLTSAGGSYDAIPCTVSYSFTGAPQ